MEFISTEELEEIIDMGVLNPLLIEKVVFRDGEAIFPKLNKFTTEEWYCQMEDYLLSEYELNDKWEDYAELIA